MDPRRYPSDASSSNGSTGSVWSTTESESFVYTDDPYWAWWGYEGVRGAVTRKVDRLDERRVRVAAHFLRGPFAGHKSKKHSSHHHHHRDSDSQSSYSSSSGSSSSSRRHRQFSGGPSPMPPPPHANPGAPHMHYQQQHPQHFGHYPQGPPMGGMMGQRPAPPPPPPAMAGPPPQPGFEAGFIQLNGGGGGGPPQRDPVWGHDAQYNGEPEVWD